MKLLREPLVHFLLLGAALFILFEATRDTPVATNDAIEVTPGLLEHLTAGFERTWRRSPNEDELLKLVQDQIRDEVFYREAIALGLEKDDALIRRRLRQKLETLQEETAESPAPTADDLLVFFEQNLARYEQPPKLGFDQVFVEATSGPDAVVAAQSKLARLRKEETVAFAEISDPCSQPNHFEITPQPLLALAFGEPFVVALTEIEAGSWAGPIESALGLHLVRVNERTVNRTPELAEVREAVERDWAVEQRRRVRDDVFQELQERYSVSVTVPGEQGARIAEVLGASRLE